MRDDALFDVEYGYWFNQANERLYHRLDVLLNVVQLVGGSAAAWAALQQDPRAVVAAGMALAVCAAVALVVQPAVKAEQHRACKALWRTLKGRAARMGDEDLVASVAELQGSGPAGLGTLAMPAYNATLRATGREESVRALSVMQRVVELAS